jgi:hypothetical protein
MLKIFLLGSVLSPAEKENCPFDQLAQAYAQLGGVISGNLSLMLHSV